MSKPFFSRRDFLRTGALTAGAARLSLSNPAPAEGAPVQGRAKSCIVLFLVGGPSQLETWDPKPTAPAEVRGPFRAISTSVPGTQISEHLPRLACLAHRYAILRTVHHTAAPIHETGQQLLQTGHLTTTGLEFPHIGAVLAQRFGPRSAGVPPFVVLPTRIGNTGINIGHGQAAGRLGAAYEPHLQVCFAAQRDSTDRERYGKTSFGDACLQALHLVEQGARCVVVNMFDTVYDRITWDCHAAPQGLRSTLDDYRRTLCPTFDKACAGLLDDLQQRGLLDETLVAAMGEFGRTPRVNAHGGRDHWPGCWSIMVAGGGVRGGQAVGVSDRLGAEPIQRPIACAEVAASIYHALGVPPRTSLIEAAPVRELFN